MDCDHTTYKTTLALRLGLLLLLHSCWGLFWCLMCQYQRRKQEWVRTVGTVKNSYKWLEAYGEVRTGHLDGWSTKDRWWMIWTSPGLKCPSSHYMKSLFLCSHEKGWSCPNQEPYMLPVKKQSTTTYKFYVSSTERSKINHWKSESRTNLKVINQGRLISHNLRSYNLSKQLVFHLSVYLWCSLTLRPLQFVRVWYCYCVPTVLLCFLVKGSLVCYLSHLVPIWGKNWYFVFGKISTD